MTDNIFDRKFSVDFRTKEDWSTECVDLVAPDGIVFFTDGSLSGVRAGADVFSNILNVRKSCWPLNCMRGLPELYYSTEILFRNWFCRTEFDWCGSLDTVVSMEMRKPTHLQERDQLLLLWCRSFVFRWRFRVSSRGSKGGYLNHTAPHGAWRLLVDIRESVVSRVRT
jgi:hypothetical protein